MNHTIGLDRDAHYSPEYSEKDVREAHASHRMQGNVCRRCGARAHWPAIERPCQGKSKRTKTSMHIDTLHLEMSGALDEFISWWKARQHHAEVPSLNEWIAELIEYRRQKK